MSSYKTRLAFLTFFGLVSCVFISYLLTWDSDKLKDIITIVKYRHEWTINANIIQYSTIIFVDKNENIIVEGLLFLNYSNENSIYNNKNIRCLIPYNQLIESSPYKITKIPLMNMGGTNVALWKIMCNFSNTDNILKNMDKKYEKLNVAIIDTSDFYGESNLFINNTAAIIPSSQIKYQTPTIYYENIPKKKSLANCVHLVRGLNSIRQKRLLNWLDIQFKIGYNHISFYFFEKNDYVKKLIKEKYSDDKVIIVDYQSKIEDVCKYEYEMIKNYPNSTLFINLFNLCKKSFDKHFTMNKGYTSNAHERMNTNDCYMHYKYEYEYVTNYDFDEIIFPRRYQTNHVPYIETLKCNKSSISEYNYNLYDYAKNMFEKHNKKAACLLFEHVLFVELDNNFINSLNESFKISGINSEIKLIDKSNKTIFFNITENDKKYLNYLLQAYNLHKCLNLTYMNQTRFSSLWNNVFAVRVNNRDGKSIFNTDYTEGINQHYTSNSVSGSKNLRMPVTDGYSSHYRESVQEFFYQQHPTIQYFFIDIEYYYFLVNNF